MPNNMATRPGRLLGADEHVINGSRLGGSAGRDCTHSREAAEAGLISLPAPRAPTATTAAPRAAALAPRRASRKSKVWNAVEDVSARPAGPPAPSLSQLLPGCCALSRSPEPCRPKASPAPLLLRRSPPLIYGAKSMRVICQSGLAQPCRFLAPLLRGSGDMVNRQIVPGN